MEYPTNVKRDDELPPRAVVIDREGDAWQSDEDAEWFCQAAPYREGKHLLELPNLFDIFGPITLVYVPGKTALTP